MKLSKYFSRSEFACKCGCGFDTVDAQLLYVLTKLRAKIGAKIYITSGCRCINHNKKVGGKKGSYHLVGKAVDIKWDWHSHASNPAWVVQKINEIVPNSCGVIAYSRQAFVHLDVRKIKYRFTDNRNIGRG